MWSGAHRKRVIIIRPFGADSVNSPPTLTVCWCFIQCRCYIAKGVYGTESCPWSKAGTERVGLDLQSSIINQSHWRRKQINVCVFISKMHTAATLPNLLNRSIVWLIQQQQRMLQSNFQQPANWLVMNNSPAEGAEEHVAPTCWNRTETPWSFLATCNHRWWGCLKTGNLAWAIQTE